MILRDQEVLGSVFFHRYIELNEFLGPVRRQESDKPAKMRDELGDGVSADILPASNYHSPHSMHLLRSFYVDENFVYAAQLK